MTILFSTSYCIVHLFLFDFFFLFLLLFLFSRLGYPIPIQQKHPYARLCIPVPCILSRRCCQLDKYISHFWGLEFISIRMKTMKIALSLCINASYSLWRFNYIIGLGPPQPAPTGSPILFLNIFNSTKCIAPFSPPSLGRESLKRERESLAIFGIGRAEFRSSLYGTRERTHTHTEAKLFCAQVIHRQRSEREGARGHTRPGITLGRQAFRRIFFVPLTSRTWGFCSRLVDKYLFLFPIFFQISERKRLLAVNHQEEPCRRVSS